jgi:hypothetical protein
MSSNNEQLLFRNGTLSQALTNGQSPTIYQHSPSKILKPRVDIRLDFENLHITLKKDLGWKPNAQALVKVVQRSVQHLGDIVRIVAYADWDALSLADKKIYQQWSKRAWQKDLAAMGIETRYLVNGDNQNAADIHMINDLRDLLERPLDAPDAADLIVLGTNDGDFKGVIEAAKRRRRRIALIAVKGHLSQYLLNVVHPSDIYYLDIGLHIHQNQACGVDHNQTKN